MVLCLLSRDSRGDTTELNHEETVRGPEIAISPEKSEILLLLATVEAAFQFLDLPMPCPDVSINNRSCSTPWWSLEGDTLQIGVWE